MIFPHHGCRLDSLLTTPWGLFAVARSLSILTAKSPFFTSDCSRSSAKARSGRYVPPSFQTARSQPPCPQVRMVQHKQTRATYALKYINKLKAVKMKAVGNIIQERRLLEKVRSIPTHLASDELICAWQIDHPFVVNLRYAFQDDENCFFVLDLMLGGDLRCECRLNPRGRNPLTSAIFRSRAQSICCETTLSAKKLSGSTLHNSHLPSSTFTNTASSTGKFRHANSRSSAPSSSITPI